MRLGSSLGSLTLGAAQSRVSWAGLPALAYDLPLSDSWHLFHASVSEALSNTSLFASELREPASRG